MIFKPKACIFDFDGVISTGDVWVDSDGREVVQCHRTDSYGIYMLRKANIRVACITSERNSVVWYRCKKMGIERTVCTNDPLSKFRALVDWVKERGFTLDDIVYVGDDLNDQTIFANNHVYTIAVNNAHPIIKDHANYITDKSGGQGAVREVCEKLLAGDFKRP